MAALGQWWGCAECCGQEQLLCDCGSVTSTVAAPVRCNDTAVCKSSMLCRCSTAVDSSPCMSVAPILEVVDQRVLMARKKEVSVTANLLHERHLSLVMFCKSMVISK